MIITDFFLGENMPGRTSSIWKKERATLANKATVFVIPKIFQLDLSSEMFSAKYCLAVDLLGEFSQLVRFLKKQIRI